MPDTFESLSSPPEAVHPDAVFAQKLRDRLAHALSLPKGVNVSLILPVEDLDRTNDDAEGMKDGDIGYISLWVPDVARASAFFGAVLGWSYGAGSVPEGRQVENAVPHHGLWGGHERSNLFLCFVVRDLEAAMQRVRDAGGVSEEPTVEPYGRISSCVDNQGTAFAIYQEPAGPSSVRGAVNGTKDGDVSYLTMEAIDSAKTRAFYGAVFGWHFSPGQADDGWGADDTVPMIGLHGGYDQATVLPMYRVDDIVGAVDRLRAQGGTASDPEQKPYGLQSNCCDDQGTRFYLGQH